MSIQDVKQAMTETQPTGRGYMIPPAFVDRLIALYQTNKEQASIEWEEYKRSCADFVRRIGG